MSERTTSVPAAARIPRFTAPVLGVALAVCYAAAMALDFEFDIGHFAPDSVFFHAAAVLGLIGCALSVFYAASLCGRTVFLSTPEPSPLSVFGGILAAGMAVLVFMQTLLGYGEAKASETLLTAGALSSAKLFLISAAVGLFLAAAVLLPLKKERRRAWYTLICILLGGLSVNIAMFAAYFDFSLPLNSPVRNFTTLMQAAVLLFLLSEARIALSSEPPELPPAFQFFASSACALFGIGIGGGGALWRLIRSLFFGSGILTRTPEPNLPMGRLILYFAVGCIAADRLLHSDIRLLTAEEIAENKRKAKEEAENKKNKSSRADGQPNTK